MPRIIACDPATPEKCSATWQSAGVSANPDPPPARPAATVIVTRQTGAGLEVLLLKRSQVGAFAGMWVFPGGRVDDADPGHDELSRAASAAVREAVEEVGIAVDPTGLIPLSHWTPPAIAPKRFTTWFFVAPWGGDEVRIDNHEIVDSTWIHPAAALEAGLPMAPPTHVTLVTLIEAGSLAGVRELVERRGIERFLTVPVQHEGSLVLLWEPDAGYFAADPTLPGPRHRMVIPSNALSDGGPQFYERSAG
jgi:8-oxo-dGTP pyrophosphatase MutT (NUDIX family)